MEKRNPLCELAGAVRRYREGMLADPYRPTWHFAIPDDNGVPGDPNGAFFADGRYHLMYLYHHTDSDTYRWGHISSRDLLHWRHHPDALTDEMGDKGCFSGGGFLDDDGTAYLTFWKFPSADKEPPDKGGIAIAKSVPPYDKWERFDSLAIESSDVWGVCDRAVDGKILHLGCADPGNIWKDGDTYYLETGNRCVLDAYGRGTDPDPLYRGDYTDLFSSKDLRSWDYCGRFYENPHTDETYPDATEDDMCPQFLPLPDAPSGGNMTDRYLQLFIAHNRGAQYYVGEWKKPEFIPFVHGRFSWADSGCFAPEALIDNKNRQLAWFWFRAEDEEEFRDLGWTGVYTFPRALWWEDGVLRMAPAEELRQLESHAQTLTGLSVCGNREIPVHDGRSFRLTATVDVKNASRVGFSVLSDGTEETVIVYDAAEKTLVVDTAKSGCRGWRVRESAPFALRDGEKLTLDVLVDHSTVEVYANERQAIARRVYPSRPEAAVRVHALCEGGTCEIDRLTVRDVEPTNPY